MAEHAHATAGTLYGVSVGPGDPELMTVKAVRIISEADVVAVPDAGRGVGAAQSIAANLLEGKEILPCPMPMTRDATVIDQTHHAVADTLCGLLDQGKSVAYLCLGDVSIYSSYGYLHQLVSERGYPTEVIPGVTSVSAAAARLGTGGRSVQMRLEASTDPDFGTLAAASDWGSGLVGEKVALAAEGLKSKLVLQIHDELLFDCPRDEVPRVEALAKREMESALDLGVPLEVAVGHGANWLEAH